MSVMIFKPSQEVAGSGSAGREKAGGTPGDRARVGAVLTPLPSTTCRVISFLRLQKVPGRRNGERQGWGREKAPESGYNVSPVSEDGTPWQRPWPGFLQQKKNRGCRRPLSGASRPLSSWVCVPDRLEGRPSCMKSRRVAS